MKPLLILATSLLMVSAQDTTSSKIELYDTDWFGNQAVFPHTKIEESAGEIRVYGTDYYGNRDVRPYLIIEKDPITGDLKVYNTNYFGGIKYPAVGTIKVEE